MKKITILVAMVFIALSMNAQENIVKIGVGSLLSRTINLEYERILTDKTSVLGEVAFGLGTNVNDGLITATGLEGGQNSINVTSGRYNNFYLVGEYRYYTKGEAGKGFYVAPYLKLANYSLDFEGTYDNSTNGFVDVPAQISTGMFVAAIGGTMGMQWLIKDKVAINWNIIGLGGSINRVSAGFTADDENVFDVWSQDVRDFLDELPASFGERFDVASENSTRTIDAAGSVPFINLRVSLSVGYKF